jgi:hypothetical protein
MKTLVLAAALVFSIAAPATTAPAAVAAAAPASLPQPGWPLLLSGLAAALWVARRRLNHTL